MRTQNLEVMRKVLGEKRLGIVTAGLSDIPHMAFARLHRRALFCHFAPFGCTPAHVEDDGPRAMLKVINERFANN